MAHMFEPPPEPVSDLARPRFLSPTAAVRVSPLCLGAMSIGDAWTSFMGSMSKEQSFKLLDAFVENGGNFIDTACNYQDEQSEMWLGEWMKERGIRDQMVIATKFTTNYRSYELGKNVKAINFGGNSRKSLHLSVRDSLAKLQTDYIDILYVHWWDWATSVEELMDSLHVLVEQGKVLYLGVSDTPAWVVAACNTYAKAHGKTPFCVYQGRWSIMIRDFEREILPMARHFGMALCPWDVLGGGMLQTKKQLEQRAKANEGLRGGWSGGKQTPEQEKMSAALEKVAGQIGADSIQAVALAYVMQKAQYVIPIVGGRKVEHLKDNIKALSIRLSDAQIKDLEDVVEFKPGFPNDILGEDPHYGSRLGPLVQTYHLQWQKDGKPIGHE